MLQSDLVVLFLSASLDFISQISYSCNNRIVDAKQIRNIFFAVAGPYASPVDITSNVPTPHKFC